MAARRTRYRYAVTFEYEVEAPDIIRGEIVVPNASLGARRAVEAARKACPNRAWSSMVVLLERLNTLTTEAQP